jgi:hypothetical protein
MNKYILVHNHFLFALVSICITTISIAQTDPQTVGVFQNSEGSFNGYTLVAASGSHYTHLIDNCGYEINTWESSLSAGMMAYLLDDGSLLRCGNLFSPVFLGGGIGGAIEKYSWEGDQTWSYSLANDTLHLHHDVEELPNGNILAIAWKLNSNEDAISKGRLPQLSATNVWSTYIVEIEPTYPEGGNIVWSWNAWDHLVQNTHDSIPNYGIPSEYPRKIDVNYAAEGGSAYSARDWLHSNSIDYNSNLDQIIVSIRGFNELWIINHNTTTSEAVGEAGDLMYRWGNPAAYGRGDVLDQKFFQQHDCQWIEGGLPYEGEVLIYNNGNNRPEGYYSTVNQIQLPEMEQGQYPITTLPSDTFLPEEYTWSFPDTLDSEFFSQNMSGAQRLPNGNTLICEGASGHIFEVDSNKELVWDYINPINTFGSTQQGNATFANSVFRSERYAPDCTALQGRDLSPSVPLELNPYPSDCIIYSGEPCLGDFDSNGIITIVDVLNVLGEFGCLLDCEYDLDSDGFISINDFLILLQLLGSTC